MAAIALDVGTSVVKAVAFDGRGAAIATARSNARVARPHPGWAEQDMHEVWTAAAEAMRAVAAQVDGAVETIAVTAQGDGCWLVDHDGAPTGPAILWADGRAASIVTEWQRDGVVDAAYPTNGSLTHPGLANAVLAWLAQYDPDRLERSAHLLHCGGWLYFNLTGQLAVDESDAAAPFLDLSTGAYSLRLLDLNGLSSLAHLLPEIRRDGTRVEALEGQVAAQLGMPAGVPVVLCPYDISTTAIGSGATTAGEACTILGTTVCTEVVQRPAPPSGTPSGWTIPYPGALTLRAFPTLSGTATMEWARRMLGLDDVAQLGWLAAKAPAGSGGLTFLPYMSSAGERVPFLDPQARGTLIGLTIEHGREQVARAVFEGLTLAIADCLHAAGAQVTQLRCCGGGSSSDFWCQLIADVTGVPVQRTADAEVGAKGAFLVGQVAIGQQRDLAEAAASMVTTAVHFQPQAALTDRYRERYADMLEVRRLAHGIWHRHDQGGHL